MSRETKLRAWNKESKQYVPPMTIQEMIYSTKNGFSLEQLNEWFIFEQYTGLNDNNGVEIYKGDIVKWGHLNNEEKTHRVAIVEMYPDIQFHLIKNNVVFKFGSFAYQDTENHLEIIGNIHENEELLR